MPQSKQNIHGDRSARRRYVIRYHTMPAKDASTLTRGYLFAAHPRLTRANSDAPFYKQPPHCRQRAEYGPTGESITTPSVPFENTTTKYSPTAYSYLITLPIIPSRISIIPPVSITKLLPAESGRDPVPSFIHRYNNIYCTVVWQVTSMTTST